MFPVFAFFSCFAFGFSPGLPEMAIIAIIGLLLFGKRLPEVARSLGKGLVEFKKGVSGIEESIDQSTQSSPDQTSSRPAPQEEAVVEATKAPKFEPPKFEPQAADEKNAAK